MFKSKNLLTVSSNFLKPYKTIKNYEYYIMM